MGFTRTEKGLVWGLAVFGALVAIASIVFGLYQVSPWFDEVLRAYNFCALTLLLALCSYGVVLAGAREHGFLLVLAITVIGLGLGALWEIGEFAYDRIVAPPSSILAKFDTIMDMLLDTGGALVAGLLLLWMLRKHEQDTRSRRRREITKVLFFDLDGSLTEARVPFAVAGFVLFLVAFVGGHVGAGRTNPDQKGAAL